ncbi:MAG TPA: glycine betaine ABC transporter substrate-binding protein, partial [Synergistales bacterium]|nr:glycine betaine ABC transporter substrate-binding protein [Synergistales bacterium]HQO83985.1 glycine betaine ABC transporter substrate-binding protein [Synergistales bacterium]HQQ11380.1 glycine betaine ABC transporter substrate-binding protein [Synergistales bacterium]
MKRLLCTLITAALVLVAMGGFAAASPLEKETVFGDQSWDSIQFLHRVMGYILQHGYGMNPVYSFSESMPSLIGLERGDNHIILEVWVEARQEWWDSARQAGKVLGFGKVFPNAPSGLYVPSYLVKGDPERGIEPLAPDLVSVFDLPRYQHLFPDPEDKSRGRVYNAVSGWAANERYIKKFDGYKVDGKPLSEYFNLFDPGSQTALNAAIRGAHDRGLPIVAYYWEPTPLLGELDMILLKEPEYDEKIFRETFLCQNPAFSVEKAANAKWVSKHPEVVPLLEKFYLSLEKTNEVLAWMEANGNDPQKAAIWFLKENPELLRSWIDDPEVKASVEKALEKEKIQN